VAEDDEFRQPPHDIDAEQAALGGMLLSRDALAEVAGILGPASFYRPAHRLVFEAALAVREHGESVDAITVANELRSRGQLPRVGGAEYLHTLVASVPTVANAGHYAGIVESAAVARRRIEVLTHALQLAWNPAADPAAVDAAAAGLTDIATASRGARARRSWRPVDLGSVLDGTYQRPEPTVGTRDDGRGLFYPKRLHVIAAESEAGKTWLALAVVAEELARGRACVYLDFEDDEGGVVGRLMTMGIAPSVIQERFAYIRPEDSIEALTNRQDLAEVLGDLQPSLAILDGVTEAMSLHGLELKDNTDVAKFGRMLPKWIADRGPAAVALDHVVKDREARGGYALGGVHKLNGLNGAMYIMENREPFGIGRTGKSRVLVRKDRPGQLRRHGIPAHDGLFWYADLVVESRAEEFAEVWLPAAKEQALAVFRPTGLMAKVCAVLAQHPNGLSKNAIETSVGGKAATVRGALDLLVSEGYVTAGRVGTANVHKLARPFTDD
jgi:hypothetical protein